MNSNNEEPWITMNDFVEIDDTEKNAEKKQEPEKQEPEKKEDKLDLFDPCLGRESVAIFSALFFPYLNELKIGKICGLDLI